MGFRVGVQYCNLPPPPPLIIGYCLMTVHCLMKWPQYLFRDAQKQIFLSPLAWFSSLFCFYDCSLIDDVTPVIVLGSLIANCGGSFFFIHFFWRVRLWLFITWWYDTNICNGGNILEIWFLLRLFVICAIKLEFSVYHFVPNNLNTMKCSAYYKVFICFDLNMSTWNQFLLELLSCRYWWSNRGFFLLVKQTL